MARVVCPCLNISIFTSASAWQSNPIATLKLFPDGCSGIKGDTIYEVKLDVAGIVVEQKVLAYSRCVGDWVIHSCRNCDTDVYIVHAIKGDRTFVLPGVLSGDEAVQMYQNKDYSSIFKILLRPIQEDDGDMFQRKRVSSMSFGREDPDMKIVHQQMKSYLQVEEEAMEHRIRVYEDEQRKIFLTLQEKAHKQRSLLFAVIAKARENVITEEIKSSYANTGSARQEAGIAAVERVGATAAAQKVTITIQDKSTHPSAKMPTDTQEFSLFTLEGFDDENDDTSYGEQTDGANIGDIAAFPQSDDEDNSTNDSSFRDVSGLSGMNLATSVPVSIPLFKRLATGTATLTDTTDGSNVNSGDVGSSIRQLALSVQDTGMFGDLPRPRMMTNPFS